MAEEASIIIPVELDDKQAKSELNRLNHDMLKLQQSMATNQEKKSTIEEQLRQAQVQAEQTRQDIIAVNAAIRENQSIVNGYYDGGISEKEYADAQSALRSLNQELTHLNVKRKEEEKTVNSIAAQENAIAGKLQEQNAQYSLMQNQVGQIHKNLINIGSDGMRKLREDTKKSSDGFGKALKNILKYGLGIRSVFVLVNRLRKGLVEGVKAFAKADDETRQNIAGLKSALATLKGSWSAAFAPILNAVAPILQTLISWLTRAGEAVAKFMAILSGKGSYKRAVANQNALADSIEATGGAAADAQKQLAGFDELTKLEENAGGGGGGSGATEFEEMEADGDGFVQRLREVTVDWFNSIDFSSLSSAWGRLKESIKGVSNEIKGGLLWAYENVLLPVGTWVATEVAPIALDIISKSLDIFRAVLEKLKPVFQWFWDNVIQPLAERADGLFTDALQDIDDLLSDISALLNGDNTTWKEFIEGFDDDRAAILGVVGVLIELGKHFTEINEFVSNFTTKITQFFNNAHNKIRDAVSGVSDFLTEKFGAFGAMLGGIIEIVGGVIETIWGIVQTAVSLIWAAVGTVVEFIGGLVHGDLKIAFETIGKMWSGVWDGIKNTAKSVANIVLATVEAWINRIIAGINKILDGANAVAAIFGGNLGWHVNYVSLPRLAKGGIVDGATPFIAGEAGKEAIIPLERNTEWIRNVASELAGMLFENKVLDRIASEVSKIPAAIDRYAVAMNSIPLPAMATGSVIPPMITVNGISEEFGESILSKLDELSARIQAMNDRDFTGYATIDVDRRKVGEIVTRYQREAERAGR